MFESQFTDIKLYCRCFADNGKEVQHNHDSIHKTRLSNEVNFRVQHGNLCQNSLWRPQQSLTIEWMEYNKAMGVEKMLAYTYNLTQQALAVLWYYEKTGFLELRKFDLPNQGTL